LFLYSIIRVTGKSYSLLHICHVNDK
jgi:hypothetical protein